jgi:hypothetical protein
MQAHADNTCRGRAAPWSVAGQAARIEGLNSLRHHSTRIRPTWEELAPAPSTNCNQPQVHDVPPYHAKIAHVHSVANFTGAPLSAERSSLSIAESKVKGVTDVVTAYPTLP